MVTTKASWQQDVADMNPEDARAHLRKSCGALNVDQQAAVRKGMAEHKLLGPTFSLKDPDPGWPRLIAVCDILDACAPQVDWDPTPASEDDQRRALNALAELPPDLAKQAATISGHVWVVDASTPDWVVLRVLEEAAKLEEKAQERHRRLMGDLNGWDIEPGDDDLRHAIVHWTTRGRTSSSRQLNADETDRAVKAGKDIGKGLLVMHVLDDGTHTLVNPNANVDTGEITDPPAAGPNAADIDWKAEAGRVGTSQAALLRQARLIAAKEKLPAPGTLKTLSPEVQVLLLAWIEQQATAPPAAGIPAPAGVAELDDEFGEPIPSASGPAEPAAPTEASAAVLVVVHEQSGIRIVHVAPAVVAQLLGAA